MPAIRLRMSAFSATVSKQGSAWVLNVYQRQVKLEMGKVLLILIDQLMSVVSAGEYRCIDEATWCAPGSGCIVDCEGLARDVENATGGIVDAGTVQELCGRGVRAVGGIVEEALARAWPITADPLDFSGSATIARIADDGSWAFTATARARTRWLRASSGARSTAASRWRRASSRSPPAYAGNAAWRAPSSRSAPAPSRSGSSSATRTSAATSSPRRSISGVN